MQMCISSLQLRPFYGELNLIRSAVVSSLLIVRWILWCAAMFRWTTQRHYNLTLLPFIILNVGSNTWMIYDKNLIWLSHGQCQSPCTPRTVLIDKVALHIIIDCYITSSHTNTVSFTNLYTREVSSLRTMGVIHPSVVCQREKQLGFLSAPVRLHFLSLSCDAGLFKNGYSQWAALSRRSFFKHVSAFLLS